MKNFALLSLFILAHLSGTLASSAPPADPNSFLDTKGHCTISRKDATDFCTETITDGIKQCAEPVQPYIKKCISDILSICKPDTTLAYQEAYGKACKSKGGNAKVASANHGDAKHGDAKHGDDDLDLDGLDYDEDDANVTLARGNSSSLSASVPKSSGQIAVISLSMVVIGVAALLF